MVNLETDEVSLGEGHGDRIRDVSHPQVVIIISKYSEELKETSM